MQAWYNLLADKFKDGCLLREWGWRLWRYGKELLERNAMSDFELLYIVILIVGLALLSQDNKK